MSNVPESFQALVGRYFDGVISDAEMAELNRLLATDPAAAAYFAEMSHLHGMLREESLQAAAVKRASVRRSVRRFEGRPAPRRIGLLLGATAAAAAALLVVWLTSDSQKENAAQTGPTLATISGQADLLRDDARLAASTGLQLQVGDQVETKAAARVTLRYPNGMTVEMNEKTLVAICAGGLTLDRGDIYVLAAGPVTVNAGQYDEVSVLGTAFEVSRRAEKTDLRVAEGRVKYGGGGAAVTVDALQASRIAPGGNPSTPEAVELAKIAPWRVRPDDGLVGYWKFDEGAGTVAKDSSGENNHGTIHGAAWDQGRFGSALRFNGNDDCFVDLGRKPSFLIPDHVTMAMWIKILGKPQRQPGVDPSYGLLGPPRNDFRNFSLAVTPEGLKAPAWRFYLSTADQGTDPKALWRRGSEPQVLDLGRWYHVAGIISKNDGGRFALFLGGKPIGEQRNVGFTSLCTAGSAPLLIGRTHYTFNGLIDEVRIYHRVLSAEEIARLAGGGQ